MKTKTTRKYINAVWKNVYRAGYCDLQYIMRGTDPEYYNTGVYGWNWDAYADYKTNAVITTGYRNMTGDPIPDALIEKYTERAKEVIKRQWTSDNVQTELERIRRDFWDELDEYNMPRF